MGHVAMRCDQTGADTRFNLKVPLIWVPKFRKRVLTAPVAIRTRNTPHGIEMEHELHVLSRTAAVDHGHRFVCLACEIASRNARPGSGVSVADCSGA